MGSDVEELYNSILSGHPTFSGDDELDFMRALPGLVARRCEDLHNPDIPATPADVYTEIFRRYKRAWFEEIELQWTVSRAVLRDTASLSTSTETWGPRLLERLRKGYEVQEELWSQFIEVRKIHERNLDMLRETTVKPDPEESDDAPPETRDATIDTPVQSLPPSPMQLPITLQPPPLPPPLPSQFTRAQRHRPRAYDYQPGGYHPGVYHPGGYHPGGYHPGVYHPGVYHPGGNHPSGGDDDDDGGDDDYGNHQTQYPRGVRFAPQVQVREYQPFVTSSLPPPPPPPPATSLPQNSGQ